MRPRLVDLCLKIGALGKGGGVFLARLSDIFQEPSLFGDLRGGEGVGLRIGALGSDLSPQIRQGLHRKACAPLLVTRVRQRHKPVGQVAFSIGGQAGQRGVSDYEGRQESSLVHACVNLDDFVFAPAVALVSVEKRLAGRGVCYLDLVRIPPEVAPHEYLASRGQRQHDVAGVRRSAPGLIPCV